jgi:hypothetical protein
VSTETQLLDSHTAPSGFTNDAPFKKKSKKMDPVVSALKAVAICGIIASLLAAALSFVAM